MIKILGKAKHNWTREDSVVINWDNYVIKYKNDRVRPKFLAPEPVLDSWNGKETDIQHVRYDAYAIEITAKESETQFMSYLKSLDEMTIIDYEINSGNSIINQTYTVDLTKSDNFEIDVEENLGQTSGAKYTISFRTNRTVINKALPIDLTNQLQIGTGWQLSFTGSIPSSSANLDFFNNTEIIIRRSTYLGRYKRILNEWHQVGNLLTGLSASLSDICVLSDTTVCELSANQIIQAYSFDGVNWTTLGNPLDTTRAGSVITSLDSTTICIESSADDSIRTFEFDGTDWSQLGNTLTITAGGCDIVALTSTKIALVDANSVEIRDYDWDGANWTVNDVLAISRTGNLYIAKLESDRIVVVSSTDKKLGSYILDGTWSAESSTIVLPGVIAEAVCGLDINSVIVNGDDVYNYGKVYYTDYDLIDYSEPLEPIEVEWPDGSTKVARTIDKTGESALFYFETSDYDDFISDLKIYNSLSLNDVSVSEFNFESSEIADGLWRIRVDCIESVTQTDFNLAPNSTYSITMNSAAITYYTDYPIEILTRSQENTIVPWPDGKNKTARTITKKAYQFVTFTSSPETIIENVNKYNDVTISGSVLTEIETTTEEIALGLFKLTINGVYDTVLVNFDLAPLGTYTLSMNSGGITYDSDYTIVSRPKEVQKIDVEWDDGSIKTMQTIKKLVYDFVYFTTAPEDFINDVNTYTDVTLNSDVLTEIETSYEEIAPNLFRVNLNGVHTLDVDTLYTFPTSGTLLRITDLTPTNHDYYTDYDVMFVNEGANKNSVDSQTGVIATTKAITKEVKQAKFFLTEANAFALKKWAELFKIGWTCTLGGATVYEIVNSANIEPIKIGVNLYEVNINCLTAVTSN